MENRKETAMAAVGDAASIMAFRSLGVMTCPAEEAQEIEQTVIRLAREGVKIILIVRGICCIVPGVKVFAALIFIVSGSFVSTYKKK